MALQVHYPTAHHRQENRYKPLDSKARVYCCLSRLAIRWIAESLDPGECQPFQARPQRLDEMIDLSVGHEPGNQRLQDSRGLLQQVAQGCAIGVQGLRLHSMLAVKNDLSAAHEHIADRVISVLAEHQ